MPKHEHKVPTESDTDLQPSTDNNGDANHSPGISNQTTEVIPETKPTLSTQAEIIHHQRSNLRELYESLPDDGKGHIATAAAICVVIIFIGLLLVLARLLGYIKFNVNPATGHVSAEVRSIPKIEKTDEQGRVKPVAKAPASIEEAPIVKTDSNKPEEHAYYQFFKMKYAFKDSPDPLSTTEEYYNKLKGNSELADTIISNERLEAEYLLARFRSGDSAALTNLKGLAATSSKHFWANGMLAEYYASIYEGGKSLEYFELQNQSSENDEQRLAAISNYSKQLINMQRGRDAITFLKQRIAQFNDPKMLAGIWLLIGDSYESLGLRWRKQLSYEQALKLDPDRATLRFQLAYSYGEGDYGDAMAAYHYHILQQQTPTDSTVSNNLSIIFGNLDADGVKVNLLKKALVRKDSNYVSANLAVAYAQAGFVEDAKECLQHISVESRDEPIVRKAYAAIQNRVDQDKKINESLAALTATQRRIFDKTALRQLEQSDEELKNSFIGEWKAVDDPMSIGVQFVNGDWVIVIKSANVSYSVIPYKINSVYYEPGIMHLNCSVEKENLVSKDGVPRRGFGQGIAGALLGLSYPPEFMDLVLVPEPDNKLAGMRMEYRMYQSANDKTKKILEGKELHFERQTGTESRLIVNN